jgi:hypothetical protein
MADPLNSKNIEQLGEKYILSPYLIYLDLGGEGHRKNYSSLAKYLSRGGRLNLLAVAFLVVLLAISVAGFHQPRQIQDMNYQTGVSTIFGQEVPLNGPSEQSVLDGQTWMQVIGNPNQTIPILKEEGVSTALILLGASEDTPTQYINNCGCTLQQEVQAYRNAGLQVALEWNAQGGFGRLQDMNPTVYSYVQSNPAQSWAIFQEEDVNLSSLPLGAVYYPNSSLIVPLVLGEQYYVYQFYSPSQFSWLYNETYYLAQGGTASNFNTPESGIQLPYGSAYDLFYNSTGLYLHIKHTLRTTSLYYRLHWIQFNDWGNNGLIQWASLFFPSAFSAWESSLVSFAQTWQGKINVWYEDNGGFPSYDANPAIISYLENTYHFTFTMNGWVNNDVFPNLSESQSLWLHENYLLMSRYAEVKQQIAHEYGILVGASNSDQKTGDQFELGHLDEFDMWDGLGGAGDAYTLPASLGSHYALSNNYSVAYGSSDWVGSPEDEGASASFISALFSASSTDFALNRPQGGLVVLDFQFPTAETPTSTIQALSYWTQRLREAVQYGRYVSEMGAHQYTVGSVYLLFPASWISGRFYAVPSQIGYIQYGDLNQWLGTPKNSITVTAEAGGYIPCDVQHWFIQIAAPYNQLQAACHVSIASQFIPYYASLAGNSSAFYVDEVGNTYVFQSGNTYYIILDNQLNQSRVVTFAYHKLLGYQAVDVNTGSVVANNTLVGLASLSSQLIILEPTTSFGGLLYTNSQNFYSSNGVLNLENSYSENITFLYQSATPIGEFKATYPNATVSYILTSSNTTFIRSTRWGSQYFYTITLSRVVSVQIAAFGNPLSSQTINKTTDTSSSTSASSTTSSSSTLTSSTTTESQTSEQNSSTESSSSTTSSNVLTTPTTSTTQSSATSTPTPITSETQPTQENTSTTSNSLASTNPKTTSTVSQEPINTKETSVGPSESHTSSHLISTLSEQTNNSSAQNATHLLDELSDGVATSASTLIIVLLSISAAMLGFFSIKTTQIYLSMKSANSATNRLLRGTRLRLSKRIE